MRALRAWAFLALAVSIMNTASGLRCSTCRSTREESCPGLFDLGGLAQGPVLRLLATRPTTRSTPDHSRSAARCLPPRTILPTCRCRPPPPAAARRSPSTGVPVPVARKQPEQLQASFDFVDSPARVDNYAWMRNDTRNDSAVLSHLQVSLPLWWLVGPATQAASAVPLLVLVSSLICHGTFEVPPQSARSSPCCSL